MVRNAVTSGICAFILLATAAAAQTQPPKVQADLISAVEAIQPGMPFTVGLRQRITPHWHTYWKNPGDSGEPTRITWTLPDGFAASDIRWPTPAAIPVGPLMNYGYSNTLLLPVTITPPTDFEGSSARLTAKANWLVCERICIPESADLTLTLPVAPRGSAATPSAHANLFAQAERSIPSAGDWPAVFEQRPGSLTLKVAAPELDPKHITAAEFFPDTWGPIEHAALQKIGWDDGGIAIEMKPGELSGSGLTSLSGVLVLTEQLGETQTRNGFVIRASPARPTPAPAQSVGDAGAGISLWQAVLFAVLGGMILNLMPCVLPILSLKALALAGHGGKGGNEAANSGLAYLAGVLASFALLAALLVGLRSVGMALGWGFQFQSPVFVLAMAALFLALALSLSGVFDIGGGAVGLGEGLTRKAGLAGSFFTGVLATVAATPCTAPFMGVAVGYALTRPAPEMVLVLQAMGLGFALPILMLSLSRTVRGFLPKPGPWMETFKQILAFPLYATVAWLVWVLSLQTGSDGVLGAGIMLIAVGFAAWLLGSGPRSPLVRGTLAAAIAGVAFAITAPLLQVSEPSLAQQSATKGDAVSAERFAEEKVAELRAAGRPVFVNLTAAWCISCKVNEHVALRSDGFRKALAEHNVAYLKGDWTNQDDQITRVLKAYGRAGVPLYLLFPADPQRQAIVLPQLLTEAIVVRHFATLSRPQAAVH